MFAATPACPLRRSLTRAIACVAAIFTLVAAPSAARADQRAFTFVYETTTMPAGMFEIENWATWQTSKRGDSDFDRISFRHEIEYGVTDHLQMSLYFDWRYQDGESVDPNGTEFSDISVEAIYSILDPVKDFIGLAIYGEVKAWDDLIGVEGKILLQKNIGPFIIAWNGIIEAEWEGYNNQEDNGVLEETFGISAELMPALAVGFELIHEVEYEDWKEWGDHIVWIGPNVSFRQKAWWFTITPVFQVTEVAGEPDFQTRLIFGLNF